MFERLRRNDFSFLGEKRLVTIHNESFIFYYVRVGGICCALTSSHLEFVLCIDEDFLHVSVLSMSLSSV